MEYDRKVTAAELTAKAARILGVLADPAGSASERRRRLMRNLIREIQADGWIWATVSCDKKEEPPVVLDVLDGGLSVDQRTGWLEAIQLKHSASIDRKGVVEMMLSRASLTLRRSDLASDEDRDHSATESTCFAAHGLGDLLYSVHPTKQAPIFSLIGIARNTERPRFKKSVSRLTQTVLANVRWLHGPSPETVLTDSRLTPSQRVVLSYLLEGKRRGEIASLMQIAKDTVRDHTRAVLRLYNVKNQLDLVCQFQAKGRG